MKVNEDHVYGSPFAVEAKPRHFRPVYSFGQTTNYGQTGSPAEMLRWFWGVAVNERDEIAVTDTAGNNRIEIFSSDGTYLRSFGKDSDKKQI